MAAAGVRQDLLALMKIPDMDAGKARALFKAGLRDAHVRWAAPGEHLLGSSFWAAGGGAAAHSRFTGNCTL